MGAIGEATETEQQAIRELRRILRKISSLRVFAGDTVRVAVLTEKAFRQEFPAADRTDRRLANAIARGISVRQKLVEAEGGTVSAEEAAQLLGISKPAILKRYEKGKLVAFREEKQNAVRFPVWQFSEGKVLEGIEAVLEVLQANESLDDFGKVLFFLSTPRLLRGKSPLTCLREGKLTQALQAAHGYAE